MLTKAERIEEFYRRLKAAPAASSFEEAYGQVVAILNQVEDEFSGVAYNSDAWRDDGRLYPPHLDNLKEVAADEELPYLPLRDERLWVLRSLKHRTVIGERGAIAILSLDGWWGFQKAGSDGRHVAEVE